MASKHPVPSSGSKSSRMMTAQGGQSPEPAELRAVGKRGSDAYHGPFQFSRTTIAHHSGEIRTHLQEVKEMAGVRQPLSRS